MLVVVLILLAVIVLVVHCFLKFWGIKKYLDVIPGEPGHYLVGNLFQIYGNKNEIFNNLRFHASKYKIYRLWFSYVGAVCFATPEDAEVVISSSRNTDKGSIYKGLLTWLGSGLLTSTGEKWRPRRKILTSAFHFNILKDFVDVFTRQTEILLEDLNLLVRDEGFDVSPVLTNFTLRTICETAMGIRFDIETDLKEKYENGIKKMGDIAVYRVLRPWLYEKFLYIFFPSYWNELCVSKMLHKFSNIIIQKRRSNFQEIFDDINSKTLYKKRMVMLDVLLHAMNNGAALDLEGIREEVDTFVFEGHDTTSNSLGFTLMLLANHPDVQERVHQELLEIIGDSKTSTLEDLQKLTYLEMCIKESLRLYPSVPMIGRRSSCEFVTASGYKIPKNVELIVHIYDLHHNPDIYPDPEIFDPERFSSGQSVNRHPFAYLAFSGGPRNCIGQKFAMLEMKAVISGIVRKFILEAIDTPDTITLMQEIMLRSKDGIRLRLKARNIDK